MSTGGYCRTIQRRRNIHQLFITELAFKNQTRFIDQSKYGILLASTIAAIIGLLILRTMPSTRQRAS